MAMPNPEKIPLEQIPGSVDKLSPAEAYALQKKLDNKVWGDQLEALFKTIDERNKRLPPMSEEEIFEAMNEK